MYLHVHIVFVRMNITVSKVLKWILLALIAGVVIFFIAFFVLKIPSVQTRVVHIFQKSISKSIGTEISIESVELDFFDSFLLNGVYISGSDGHALALVDYAFLNIDWSLWDLIQRKITLEGLTLRNGDINLYRLDDGCPNTVFKPYKPKKKILDSDPVFDIFFDPTVISLEEIMVYESDWMKDRKQEIKIGQAKASLKSTNFSDRFEISELKVDGLEYVYDRDDFYLNGDTTCLLLKDKPDTTVPIYLIVENVDLKNGRFRFKNEFKKAWDFKDNRDYFDLADFDLQDINISADQFQLLGDSIILSDGQLNLVEKRGFQIKKLDFKNLQYLPTAIVLEDFEMVTNNSTLKNNFHMSFSSIDDFEDIGNQTKLDIGFDDIKLGIKDIMYFAPTLYDNDVFSKLQDKYLEFDGVLKGRPNNIIAKNFLLAISNEIRLQGDLNAKNLLDPDRAYLSVIVDDLQSNMNKILYYFPSLNFTEGMSSLGNIHMTGFWKGYLQNWTTRAEISTELGDLDVDLKMDLEDEEYAGDVSTPGFDLGRLVATDALGVVAASLEVLDGKRFAPKDFTAKVNGHIDEFEFQDYVYTNADLKGDFSHNQFEGLFYIEDPNLDLDFNGKVEFSDQQDFTFSSDINKADLGALGLIDQDIVLNGHVEMEILGKDFNNLNGSIDLDGFSYAKEVVPLDSLRIDLKASDDNQKNIKIQSKNISATILGKLDVINIIPDVFKLFEKNQPHLYHTLNLPAQNTKPIENYDFTYTIDVDDVGNLLRPFVDSLESLDEVAIDGKLYYDGSRLEYFTDLSSDHLNLYGFSAKDLKFLTKSDESGSSLSIKSDTLDIANVSLLDPDIRSSIYRDSFVYDIEVKNVNNTIDTIVLDGVLALPDDNHYKAKLDSASFRLRNKVWVLDTNNSVEYKPEYLFLDNIVFSNQKSNLYVQSVTEKSLIAGTRNLDAYFLNAFTHMPYMKINGELYTTVAVEDIFNFNGFEVDLSVEDLLINKDKYDNLQFNGYLINFKKPIRLSTTLTALDGEEVLKGGGSIEPLDGLKKLDFDLDLTTSNLPLSVIEYVMGSIISDSRGNLDANIEYQGVTPDAELEGTIDVDGSTVLTMLGTYLGFDDQKIKVTADKFDFNGVTIHDTEGNTAQLNGELKHHNFQDMYLSLATKTDHFKAMDLSNSGGNIFYGTAYTALDLDIHGPIEQLNIQTNVTSKPGTDIYLPLDNGTSVQTTFFYDIIDSTHVVQNVTGYTSLDTLVYNYGIYLDVTLNLTPDANVSIILDQSTGDILSGHGAGDINIVLTRSGDLTINGGYTIDEGVYNFAQLKNVVGITKSFEIESGSSILWTGDPIGATMDVTALYQTRAAPGVLIQEYLFNENIERQADNITTVELEMNLKNQLLQPDITFDLVFPDLTGELKNITTQKVNQLHQNEAELNAQAMSLLVRNQFKPPGNAFTFGQNLFVNTLSEYITSYLDQFITDALYQQLFADSDFITDIKVNNRYIRFDDEQKYSTNQGVNYDRTQYYELSADLEIKNKYDFIYVLHYDIGSSFGNQMLHDFIFKIPIREDKSLAVSLYTKQSRYQTSIRQKTGTGLIFTKSFDTFKEFRSKKQPPPAVINE